MTFLFAWLGNPIEYWPNILVVVLFVAIGVFSLRKIQTKTKPQ